MQQRTLPIFTQIIFDMNIKIQAFWTTNEGEIQPITTRIQSLNLFRCISCTQACKNATIYRQKNLFFYQTFHYSPKYVLAKPGIAEASRWAVLRYFPNRPHIRHCIIKSYFHSGDNPSTFARSRIRISINRRPVLDQDAPSDAEKKVNKTKGPIAAERWLTFF
jgi:hypothetical protein